MPRLHRSNHWRAIAVGAVVLCLIGTLAGCGRSAGEGPANPARAASSNPPALDGTSRPPWPAPDQVAARVASAGLDLGPMGTAEHYHPQLRIVIDGQAVLVPANIGVDTQTGAMSAVHTHETDGTIHIEADRAGERFTLGQLFLQWGVMLTESQIGGVEATDGRKLLVTSNGVAVAGNPAALRLEPNQTIVLQLS